MINLSSTHKTLEQQVKEKVAAIRAKEEANRGLLDIPSRRELRTLQNAMHVYDAIKERSDPCHC